MFQVHVQENVLRDVLAVYVFGGMVILPYSTTKESMKERTIVQCWKTQDEDKLRVALEAAFSELDNSEKDGENNAEGVPSTREMDEGSNGVDTTRGETCCYESLQMNPPGHVDAALITIEIWSQRFVIRSWASYESGSAKYHPILKADIPLRHGRTAIFDVVSLLLKSFGS